MWHSLNVIIEKSEVLNMPDYKETYLKMFRASEEAVNILIAAQRACEELYISSPEPELRLLDGEKSKERG